MNKKKCIIIDLEGTLSDHSHRAHYLADKNYGRYNQLFSDDPVNMPFLRILQSQLILHGKDVYVIMCTAKSTEYKNEVKTWLDAHNLSPLIDDVSFRLKLDSRSSVLVKRDMLHKIQENFEVLKAFDDRQDICEMFESEGIKAINVGIHETIGPAKILKDAADLFEEKNAEYGAGYKEFGKIMMDLFPGGIEIKNQKDASRFAILNIMVAKLDRYCKNFHKGGHADSLKDLMVYDSMLQEVDNEFS